MTLAALLQERGDELARRATDALYAARPDLLATWGPTGRQRCLEDLAFHYGYLASALALGSPDVFLRYVAWLESMLGARGIPMADLQDGFRHMADVLEEVAGPDAAPGLELLAAGCRALESHRGAE